MNQDDIKALTHKALSLHEERKRMPNPYSIVEALNELGYLRKEPIEQTIVIEAEEIK